MLLQPFPPGIELEMAFAYVKGADTEPVGSLQARVMASYRAIWLIRRLAINHQSEMRSNPNCDRFLTNMVDVVQ